MNPLKAYKETQIKTASQGKLIVMLYDEAIRQIDVAVAGLRDSARRYDSVNAAITKAQELVTELLVSLDFERGGDIAQGLFSLYMYFNRQLLNANIAKDPTPMTDVRDQLSELRDAWMEIVDRNDGPDNDGGPGRGVNIAG